MDDFWIIIAILILLFLFQGEPDVFDKLRERAMDEITTCKGEAK